MFPHLPPPLPKNRVSKQVSEAELKRLLMESGKSEKDAEFQITMVKGLGSEILIGEVFYALED